MDGTLARAGRAGSWAWAGGRVPLSTRLWENKGGPRPPDPRLQEPQPWVGRGQGPLGGRGTDAAGGGQPTAPLGGPGGVLADTLRWGGPTALSRVAQLMGWGRRRGWRTREEAGGGQATGSRDPRRSRGGDLRPSGHPGGRARTSPGTGQAVQGRRPGGGCRGGAHRAWAGPDCAVGVAPSQPLAALARALCRVPAPRPAPPNAAPHPHQSRQTRPPPQSQSQSSVYIGRRAGAPGRAQDAPHTPRRPGQPALSARTSACRPRPCWGTHTDSWATSSGFCRSDF